MLTDEQLITELRGGLSREAEGLTPRSDLLASVHVDLAATGSRRVRGVKPPGAGVLFAALSVAATAAVVLLALALNRSGESTRPAASPPVRFLPGFLAENADPDPHMARWDLSIVRSSRSQVCVSVTRAGPLHYRSVAANCAPLDARGWGFFSEFARQVPARTGLRPCRLGKPCALQNFRNLDFGLLGPDAVSVTYIGSSGKPVTVPTSYDGAYIIVLPATRQTCTQLIGGGRSCVGGVAVHPSYNLEAGVITGVRYRDGHVCHLPAPTAYGVVHSSCPRFGYVAPPAAPRYKPPPVSAAQVTAPVTTRIIYHSRAAAKAELLFQLRFRARVPATNRRSVYEWAWQETAVNPHCPYGHATASGTTTTPIRAGHEVVIQGLLNTCVAHYLGLITYQPNARAGGDTLSAGLPIHDGSVLVRHLSFDVRRH